MGFVLEKEGSDVLKYKKVVRVENCEGSRRVRIVVLDGDGREEIDEADLVVGADGVKSVVRRALFSEGRYDPIYRSVSLLSFRDRHDTDNLQWAVRRRRLLEIANSSIRR